MKQPHVPPAELRQQILRLQAAAVRAPRDALGLRDAMLDTIGLEAIDHLRVGPVEQIDA
jgi:hypothetical protein